MDAYGHLRMLISLILGLAITRILLGLSRRLQEPSDSPRSHAALIWSCALLLDAVHFWWAEFWLRHIQQWSFWLYAFVLSYAALFFLMSTLLYPDHIVKHSEREAFFLRRKNAFFKIFAICLSFDIYDTIIKGSDHFRELGPWYVVKIGLGFCIALTALKTTNSRLLALLGLLWLITNILWVTMLYSELL